MQCPNCGKVIVPGATACPECGNPIGSEAPAPPPAYAPGTPPTQPPVPGAKQATSSWAIASLILGICGFTCIPLIGSVLAIVFGFLGKSEIKKSSGRLKGSGLAAAGIVLGIILIALIVIAAAVTVPLYFVYIGPERIVTRTVDLGGATAVDAEINMKSGTLNVNGGAGQLMSGGSPTTSRSGNRRSATTSPVVLEPWLSARRKGGSGRGGPLKAIGTSVSTTASPLTSARS